MELAPLYVREISLNHSSDWINKCIAIIGLSVNPRVWPNIMWQGNNMYVYVVVRLIWSLCTYRSCHALLDAVVNYWASRNTQPMFICTWTHRVARLRGWKPNLGWTQIRQSLGFSNWASNSRPIRGRLYKRWRGRDQDYLTPFGSLRRSPMPTPIAPRRPSSPEARRFFPYVWDTSKVLHLEHKDKPHERDWRGGRPHNYTTLLLCTRLHRVAYAARLVVIPWSITSSWSCFMRLKFCFFASVASS